MQERFFNLNVLRSPNRARKIYQGNYYRVSVHHHLRKSSQFEWKIMNKHSFQMKGPFLLLPRITVTGFLSGRHPSKLMKDAVKGSGYSYYPLKLSAMNHKRTIKHKVEPTRTENTNWTSFRKRLIEGLRSMFVFNRKYTRLKLAKN